MRKRLVIAAIVILSLVFLLGRWTRPSIPTGERQVATPEQLERAVATSVDEDLIGPCRVTRVIDGDTVDAEIDLGFNTWRHVRLRLARINAPEKRGSSREKGKAATKWLTDVIEDEWLLVRTIATQKGPDKKGKYGRYLVEIFKDGKNINDELVSAGHAVYVAK